MATILICDYCDTRHNVKKYSFPYDREHDPSGNGYDELTISFDACPSCYASILYDTLCSVLSEEDELDDKYETICKRRNLKFALGKSIKNTIEMKSIKDTIETRKELIMTDPHRL